MNSWQDVVDLASKLISNDKIAGYVRAAVAAGFAMLIAKYQPLGDWIPPAAQDAIALAVATFVVGVWSHIVKAAADKQVQVKVSAAKVEGQNEGAQAAAIVANNPTPSADPTPVVIVTKDPAP